MLSKLTLFELKKNILINRDWINNSIFLLINMVIFPFTVNPDLVEISQLFISVIMTSLLLGIVLITNHIFDEDIKDGSFDQYLVFGAPMHKIYLSKVIAGSIEFALIITIILPFVTLFYAIEFVLIIKIWLLLLLSVPLLSSISIFGALLTMNFKRNTAISILLVFPLLISVLIILSLSAIALLFNSNFDLAMSYIEMNIGLTMLLIPALCWLSKYL